MRLGHCGSFGQLLFAFAEPVKGGGGFVDRTQLLAVRGERPQTLERVERTASKKNDNDKLKKIMLRLQLWKKKYNRGKIFKTTL